MIEDTQGENNFSKIGQPALRALSRAGYFKLEHLTRVSKTELVRLHGVGPKALGTLEDALTKKGLTFSAGES